MDDKNEYVKRFCSKYTGMFQPLIGTIKTKLFVEENCYNVQVSTPYRDDKNDYKHFKTKQSRRVSTPYRDDKNELKLCGYENSQKVSTPYRDDKNYREYFFRH